MQPWVADLIAWARWYYQQAHLVTDLRVTFDGSLTGSEVWLVGPGPYLACGPYEDDTVDMLADGELA